MPAPTYQAVGAFGETTTNTVSFTYPTLAANDLLFLLVYDNGYGGTLTINASWTLVSTDRTYGAIFLYRKIATGSETGTENITRGTPSPLGANFAAQCFSFRGDSFITIENFTKNRGASDTITWSSVSVGGIERTMAAFIVNRRGGNPGLPTGYTLQSDDALSDNTYFELSTKTNVSTGPSVTSTGGSISYGWTTFHVAIYNNTPALTTPFTYIVN